MRTLIVGGVAGGMSAATRLRRMDENAEILVLERSAHVSFANCGLPYFVGGVITRRESLLLETPESINRRFKADVRVNSEVVAIDRAAKTVTVREVLTGNEYTETYDNLILAPGAAPFIPPIPGVERALTLRNVADTDTMAAKVAEVLAGDNKTAVIMGGGFIGLELAENLVERGLHVSVVELADQIMAPLDVEMAIRVQWELEGRGVEVITGASVTEIAETTVTLSDGRTLPAGLVIAAIGVRPESGLAAAAGLEVNERGGIVVDEFQRTSDPSIFAVGDAVVKRDAITGDPAMVPLAGPANRHGRLVADVIAGRPVSSNTVLGTAIVGLFGMQAAATGWTEKRAVAAGRKIRVVHTHPDNHAGYYPGGEEMHLKLVIDAETDAILGAQGVGGNGVDKRIDVIATAMRGGLTASDLADLELSYAPPFSSAKDPVNMLGFQAENLRDGLVESVQWHELPALLDAGVQVIDVRTALELERGMIEGAINVPVDELRDRIDEIADDVILYCWSGTRSYVGARILMQSGRRVRHLDGGYRTWAAI
ncbi:MAG: FAD-dependent oxidoreductase [Propionibacteriales bacterium]|nr:FAD-dependent oxidoreductase [Propionibacteriales bacterium]